MKKVLFVCTGNTCRSQIAAALVNAFYREQWTALSAGTHPGEAPEPRALLVLREIGIHTSGTPPAALGAFQAEPIDLLVTLSESAQQAAAELFPHSRRVHLAVDDPLMAPYPPDNPVQPYRETRELLRELLPPLLDDCL